MAKALELAGVRGPVAIRDLAEERRLAAPEAGPAALVEGVAAFLGGLRGLFRAGAPLVLTPLLWRAGASRE